jgi:hypothetical protein
LPPSENAKLAPGEGAANASSGRATLAARPQSRPRTGGPAGDGNVLGAASPVGGLGVTDVEPQPARTADTRRMAVAFVARCDVTTMAAE